MKSVCHYCKDKKLAEQSNNLCVGCFNAIVGHYAQQKPAQDHYFETLLIGLKPEPLHKLYIKALYMSHLDYCQKIIQFYKEGKEHGKIRRRDAGKHFNRRGDLKADRLNKIATRGNAKQRRFSVSENKSQQSAVS
jgi:hypothetical protein